MPAGFFLIFDHTGHIQKEEKQMKNGQKPEIFNKMEIKIKQKNTEFINTLHDRK